MCKVPEIDFLDIDILGTAEHELYYATRNYDTIDLNPFDEGEALELDFNATAEDIAAAIVEDPFGTIGTAALLITGFGGPLALALNQGASTAYRGGSAEDIITSMALTYAGSTVGDIVGNQASSSIEQAVGQIGNISDSASRALSTALTGGTEQFATTLIHSFNPADGSFNFEAASNAFLTGNLAVGVGYTLGAVDDALGNVITDEVGGQKEWTNLGAGIRDSATAGIIAAVQGGNVTEDALSSLVRGYTGNIQILSNLQESLGNVFDENMVRVVGDGLNASLNAAIEGGLEPTDAFFANLKTQADDKIRDFINSSEGLGINNKLDTLFGNKGETVEAFEEVSTALESFTEAGNGYTTIYNEEKRLYGLWEDAVEFYNANKNQANLDAVNTAGAAYTAYTNDNAEAKAGFRDTYNEIGETLLGLRNTYDNSLKGMLTDIDELLAGGEFKSVEELTNEIASISTMVVNAGLTEFDPASLNEDVYRTFYGLGPDEDIHAHYLQNQTSAFVNDLQTRTNDFHASLLQQALGGAGLDIFALNNAQQTAALKYIREEAPVFSSVQGPDDIIRISDGIVNAINTTVGDDGSKSLDRIQLDEGVTYADVVNGEARSIMTIIDGEAARLFVSDEEFIRRSQENDEAQAAAYNADPTTKEALKVSLAVGAEGATLEEITEAARLMSLGYDVTLNNGGTITVTELVPYEAQFLVKYHELTGDKNIDDSARAVRSLIEKFGFDPNNFNQEAFENDEFARNVASVIAGGLGESIGFVADILEASNRTDASDYLKSIATDTLTFSEGAATEEWKEKRIQDSEEYKNLKAKFIEENNRQPNDNEVLMLQTRAIGNAMVSDPIHFAADHIGKEMVQEIFNIAVGGAAKKATEGLFNVFNRISPRKFGDEFVDVVSNTAGVGGALAADTAEAYFGTQGAVFDEAYLAAIAQGMSETDAELYASNLSANSGVIASLLTVMTSAVGGNALAKSIFRGSDEAIDYIGKAIAEGVEVSAKEGVTESIEEGLTTLFTETNLKLMDPSRNVTEAVAESALYGGVIGFGVAGGLYTGNYVADTAMRFNTTVQEALQSENPTVARDTLVNLGITDVSALNEMLNTSYDEFIVTTDEVGQIIASAAPGFEADADTIASYVGERSEADTRAEIEQFVGDNYVTEEEVDTAATAAGITLTDEEKTQYVGQSANETSLTTFAEDVEAAKGEIVSFFEENNYDPTDAQVNNFLDGLTLTDARKEAISSYIDPRQITEAEARQFFRDLGYEPAEDEIDRYVQQSESRNYTSGALSQPFESYVKDRVARYVDPRQITEAEARAAFADAGFEPTDEQVEQFTGQSTPTVVPPGFDIPSSGYQRLREAAIADFVDPLQTTKTEVEAAFEAAGYDPTEDEINNFVGQLEQTTQETAIGDYVDPRLATDAEIRAAFEAAGFEPTDEEVALFTGQLDQADQETKVGEYVDPRQTTEAEVRAAFDAANFEVDDETVASFVGQLNQADQETSIAEYINPLQTTRDEVVAAFDAAGFTATDEEIDSFVGQLNQADQETRIAEYIDPLQTTKAEVEAAFAAAGYTPTEDEINNFVGQLEQTAQETAVSDYVDPRLATDAEIRAAFAAAGFTPTDEEVALFTGQLDADRPDFTQAGQETGVADYVNPRQVTEAEARTYFANFGYTPTEEEVNDFVGQVSETEQANLIAQYVDPRQVTLEELQAIADQENITLTDALAAAYVGQGEAENFAAERLSEATIEFDPLATTEAEAKQYFEDAGFTPTDEQIAKFTGSTNEADSKAAILDFINPRQITASEARALFSDLGYTATEDEIANFVGQGEESFATDTSTRVSEYVDPRQVTTAEIRAAYEALGLVDVLQEDVDRFTGQRDEADALEELSQYAPTATLNIVNQVIGSPAVEDDPNTTDIDESKEATGLYASVENSLAEAVGGLENISLEDVEDTVSNIVSNLATNTDVTNALATAVASLPEVPTTTDLQNAVTEAFAGLNDLSETDVTNIFTTELEKLENLSSDDVQTIVDNTVGQKETLNEDGTVDQESTGLFGEIGGLAADIDTLTTSVGDLDTDISTLTTSVGDLDTDIGTLNTAVGNLNVDLGALQTDLTKLALDVGSVDTALTQLSTDLGTTEQSILTALGTTKTELETTLGGQISDVETTLGGQISGVETTLGKQISDLETTLGADINAVADLIGKPAREVTESDVDFVIDLVAQQNVSDELVLEYDVTGDGTVDQSDVDLLQQTLTGEDTTLADTSIFTPATGLFAQQEQDTQTTQDLITDLATNINTQINTQTQQQNVADLAELLAGARDAGGTRVDVKTPQELANITPYDFQTIFRDQQQAGKFVGPYGDPRTAFGIPANVSRPPLGRVSGFSQGGQVEDNNDMLLRILGELE
jgi:hypothetical protein